MFLIEDNMMKSIDTIWVGVSGLWFMLHKSVKGIITHGACSRAACGEI